MSYKVNDKELESVLKLPGPKRYQYFISKITDWKELWSIGDNDEWALVGDDSGNELVPVWPAERYAAVFCVGQWQGQQPQRLFIDHWLDKWVPGLIRDGRKVVIFPFLVIEE
jgi:hypothetical protein